MTTESTRTWYYSRAGSKVGPVTWEELYAQARAGNVGPDDLIWRVGMSAWLRAAFVPELFPDLPPPPPVRNAVDDPAMRWVLPVGRSGWAIAAGYMGLMSVVLVPAPLAVIFGVLAIREIRRDRTKHGMGRAIFGIVMGGLVSLAVVTGILIAIIRPD